MQVSIKLAVLAALLLTGQVMAEDVRVDCVSDQGFVCEDNEPACHNVKGSAAWYHFNFDLTKKTGSLVFCGDDVSCMDPSPLTVVHDYCAFLGDHGAGCLAGNISVWEPIQEMTYTISNSRFVVTSGSISTNHSLSAIGFGHCAVRPAN